MKKLEEFLNYTDGMKPYPNEHAARLNEPSKYVSFRRENDKFGPGISVIWGITKDKKVEIQAIRFNAEKFTVAEAKKWLKDHDYKPILFEPAKEKSCELSVKMLAITDCKTEVKSKKLYLSGYANTKNVADRYGDIPTVLTSIRNFVYDLNEYRKNPVVLVDHCNAIDHIAGSMIMLEEDEKGLKFEAEFSNSELPLIAHVRNVYKEGHAKALSIAGRFYYEDENNPHNLTLAKIYEISLVAVPADPNALSSAMEKALEIVSENIQEETKTEQICKAIKLIEDGKELSLNQLRLLNSEMPIILRELGELSKRDPKHIIDSLEK